MLIANHTDYDVHCHSMHVRVFVSRAFQLNHWFMSWEVFAHPGGLNL